MDQQPGDLSYCQTHKSMLSCLETFVADVHVDLASIDAEVNKCLPTNHHLPGNMWTPPFFKDPANNMPVWTGILPVVAELTKTHPTANHDSSNCTTCVPELPSMLLTLERETDRNVQYVNYIQEKMNAVPTTTNTTVSMVNSKSHLIRTSSISRSKIRTNPSLPVLQHSPKVLNLSQEYYDITSVSQQMNTSVSSTEPSQNSSVFQNNPPCLCCSKCMGALSWFCDSVSSKIQYLKDQCHDLKTRLMAELKEKEKELMVQLAQKRKAKQTINNNFSRLEGLGLQGLSICSNIRMFKPVNHSTSSHDSQNRYAADGQSCDEETSNPITQSTVTQSVSTSSSEGSYSLATNQSTQQNLHTSPEVSLSTNPDLIQLQENIYDEPVIHAQSKEPELMQQSPVARPSNIIPESPMPELLEFQRRRSNSVNQYDNVFSRETIRRRSNTISHPVTATSKQIMNASGPYTTIEESADQINNSVDHPIPTLLHIKSDIAVTFPDAKPRKMKKSKSSIMVRATKLKNFIAKKFKRKSWGGSAHRKSMSPTSVQASSTGVQFFEYDFSDDGEDDGSVNATSDTLGNLSCLTGTADTLASCPTGINNSVTAVGEHPVAEMTFSSSVSSYNGWLQNQIATIERHLNNTSASSKTEMSALLTTNTSNSANSQHADSTINLPSNTKQMTTTNRSSKSHIQMFLPPMPAVHTDQNYQDLRMEWSSTDNLSAISSIHVVDQSSALINMTNEATPAVPPNTSSSDQFSTSKQALNNTTLDVMSRKRLMFDTQPSPSPTRESIFSFHEDSSFDVHQGYGSYCKLQKVASTPRQPAVSCSRALPLVIDPNSPTVMSGSVPHQVPELLNHLCKDHSSLHSRQNMEKLCYVKPYLLQGRVTLSYLLNLINNYPHNYSEIPGYDYTTKKISMKLVSFVSTQTSKPHIFARNLVWRLFTLLQLYGGKTGSGQNTDSLDEDIIMAVRNVTIEQYNISSQIWQWKCVTFIHKSINYLFNCKLRSPVFRALLQQSDC